MQKKAARKGFKRKIITLTNQKGGPGKTTLTRELGIYLSTQGYNTLLIDSDPQGNLTKGLTVEAKRGVYDAYCDEPFDVHRLRDSLYLLHGSGHLSLLERNLIGEIDAYHRLTGILNHSIFEPFEYILIDTPPTFGIMTLNAFAASDYLGIVINPAVYTMQGTNHLMETYTKVRETLNERLRIVGAFLNMVDLRPVIFREILDELTSYFGETLVNPYLSRSVKIEEAIPRQAGVVELGNSKSKDEVEAMGRELLKRMS